MFFLSFIRQAMARQILISPCTEIQAKFFGQTDQMKIEKIHVSLHEHLLSSRADRDK